MRILRTQEYFEYDGVLYRKSENVIKTSYFSFINPKFSEWEGGVREHTLIPFGANLYKVTQYLTHKGRYYRRDTITNTNAKPHPLWFKGIFDEQDPQESRYVKCGYFESKNLEKLLRLDKYIFRL